MPPVADAVNMGRSDRPCDAQDARCVFIHVTRPEAGNTRSRFVFLPSRNASIGLQPADL